MATPKKKPTARKTKAKRRPVNAAPKKQRGRKPTFSVAEVTAALASSAGIIALAAQQLKTSRKTIYRMLEKHPTLRESRSEIDETTLDLAEGKLLEGIRNGDKACIIFYLKTKGKGRGYVERVEATGKNGKPLPPAAQVTVFALPDNGR